MKACTAWIKRYCRRGAEQRPGHRNWLHISVSRPLWLARCRVPLNVHPDGLKARIRDKGADQVFVIHTHGFCPKRSQFVVTSQDRSSGQMLLGEAIVSGSS